MDLQSEVSPCDLHRFGLIYQADCYLDLLFEDDVVVIGNLRSCDLAKIVSPIRQRAE